MALDTTFVPKLTNIPATWLNQINRYTFGGATAASLRSLSSTLFTRFRTLGYYTPGDGGGGDYYFDPADTTSADNGGTVFVASDGGRWKLAQSYFINTKQFGAKGDNATDDTAALQAFLDYFHSKGGGAGRVSPGTYLHNTTLTMYNNVKLFGDGFDVTQLHYPGSGHQMVITNPINSSTEANIHIEGIYFNGPNVGALHGCLFDTGSTSVVVNECFFNVGVANALGMILNQSELWSINDCYFAGTNGAWLVNGTDLSPGASTYYTNRIKFNNCQFNVTGFEVIDDGGIDHTFDTCNWNAGTTFIRAAGVNGLNIRGGEFENCTGVGITFKATRWQGAASITGSTATINGVNFSQASSNAFVSVDASCLRHLTAMSNTFNNAGTVFSGLDNCTSTHLEDNFQAGAGDGFTKINNVYSAQPATATFSSSGGGFSLGNGTVAVEESREGRAITLDVKFTVGTTTNLGTGNLQLSQPEASAGLEEVSAALFTWGTGNYAGIALADNPAGFFIFFAGGTSTGAVSATVPAAVAAGNILRGTLRYTALHQVG